MKAPEYMPGLLVGLYALSMVLVYKRLTWIILLMSLGVGAIVHSVTNSLIIATGSAMFTLFATATLISVKPEGFNTAPQELANEIKKIKASTYEGFNTNTPPSEISALLNKIKLSGIKEGFSNMVAENVVQAGAPGFGMKGPLVEGYEDVKVEKNEQPAPAMKSKDTMAMPFTLGEIPAQVKNGPHIDAGSTLIQAIKGLNPDQINAMTKDTQQLIETQKSLMGMLGTMKPMLNDGKQLMDTFQQMFG